MQSCTEVREAVPSESLSGKVPPPNMSPARDCGDLCSQRGTWVSFSSVDWCTGGNSSPPESGLVNLLLPPPEGRDLGGKLWDGKGLDPRIATWRSPVTYNTFPGFMIV